MSSTDQLVESLFDLWRWLRHMSNDIRQGDLTREQSWLLHQLRRRGALSIGEVAEILSISQSTSTTACKRLEAAGLITRTRRSDDERVVDIALTDLGRATVEDWRRRRREAVTDLLTPLDDAEQDMLQQLIQRLLDGTSHTRVDAERMTSTVTSADANEARLTIQRSQQ